MELLCVITLSIDLLMFLRSLNRRINHLQHYCTPMKLHLKRCQSRKGAAAFQWKKGSLQSKETHSSISIAVFICSKLPLWGLFCQWFPYIARRRCSAGCERCRSAERQSLAVIKLSLKITCCPHDYPHYCFHEQETSVDAGCWEHVYQAASSPFSWSDDRWRGIWFSTD